MGLKRFFAASLLLAISSSATAQTATERNWVDTEAEYRDAAGHVLTVRNSLPRGGGEYTDATWKKYSYVIFWTRVVNGSGSAVELDLSFPAVPLPIFDAPDSHIRLFLPPDAMTEEKIQMHDYGLTGLKAFLDDGFHKPSGLKKTLKPNETHYFYTRCLSIRPVEVFPGRPDSAASP